MKAVGVIDTQKRATFFTFKFVVFPPGKLLADFHVLKFYLDFLGGKFPTWGKFGN